MSVTYLKTAYAARIWVVVKVSTVLSLLAIATGSLNMATAQSAPNVHKGQRYRTTQAFKVTLLTTWKATAASGGREVLFPAGEVLVIMNSTKDLTWCLPERYFYFEQLFVSSADRNDLRYFSYSLYVRVADLRRFAEVESAAKEETIKKSVLPH